MLEGDHGWGMLVINLYINTSSLEDMLGVKLLRVHMNLSAASLASGEKRWNTAVVVGGQSWRHTIGALRNSWI